MLVPAQNPLSADSAAVAGAALRTFFSIAEAWRLNVEQAMVLLGLDSRSTYFKWKKQPESASLNADKLERLSYIFGIYKALQILLPRAEAADQWLHQANQAAPFAGQSALQRMLSGRVADLYVVRQYLDGQRG
ncbi:MbcA/ParS/Xre antitoxin family protein [Methylomonas sp. MED-D]|uniref:MbcA/ParS/Xre antitoxin family protein n=1 Tax=Methylomonas sp. MED-D TaxID=3418768 RepID=UPI003D07D81B